ncbi:hypothetical protein ACFL96_13700 [Thermoproteota archaeon]
MEKNNENISIEYKSLDILTGKKENTKKLAWECVCLANSVGGTLYIS